MYFDKHTQYKFKKNDSVAIIICGMIREWQLCADSFYENFIKPNKSNLDIDIFLITYDVTDRYETNRKQKDLIHNDEFDNLKKQFNTDNLHIQNFIESKEEILNYMNSIDNTPLHISSNRTQRNFLETIYMQTYLLKKSLSFINSKNKNYDCVIRTRFDILYDERTIIPNEIMVNSVYNLPFKSNQNFVDNCFFGDFESMKKMLSSYDFLLENPNSTVRESSNYVHYPYVENLFLQILEDEKINCITKERWKLSILRDKNNYNFIPRLKLYGQRHSPASIKLNFPPSAIEKLSLK
tara:strand:+ start:153 stop:1037 length:885 start_codon:yes stop_codon:yes gene_type:complete